MRIKVLHFTTHLRPGGTETQLVTMLAALDRERFDHHIGYAVPGGALAPRAEALGLPMHHLSFTGRAPGPGIWRDTWRMRRHIEKEAYDVVVVYHHVNVWAAIATAGLRRSRLIIMQRGIGAGYPPARVRMIHRISYPIADRIVVNAERLKRILIDEEGVPGGKIVVIHNGVDVGRYSAGIAKPEARRRLGLPQGAFIVGAVARLVPEKGLGDMIEAVAMLEGDVHLVVAGGGPLHGALQEQARSLGIADRVHLLGERDDVQDILAALDVGALSSHTEGLPNALLEYMSAGLPCVATDVGGVREVVVDGRTGRVVPAKAPRKMAEAIAELIRRPDLAAAWGEAGRRRAVEEFSIAAACGKLEALLLEVAGRARAGRQDT